MLINKVSAFVMSVVNIFIPCFYFYNPWVFWETKMLTFYDLNVFAFLLCFLSFVFCLQKVAQSSIISSTVRGYNRSICIWEIKATEAWGCCLRMSVVRRKRTGWIQLIFLFSLGNAASLICEVLHFSINPILTISHRG